MRLIDADTLPKQIGIEPTHDLADFQYWVNFTAIDNAPTVDAIPVEWIKDWRKEKWFDRRLSMEERMVRAMVARMILEDWEEENETD